MQYWECLYVPCPCFSFNKPHDVRVESEERSVLTENVLDHRRWVLGYFVHIFQTVGSQMTVRLPVLRAGRFLRPRRFMVFDSVTGWDDPSSVVWLLGLNQLKNRVTLTRIEPATFPSCSIVYQPSTLSLAAVVAITVIITMTIIIYRFLSSADSDAIIPTQITVMSAETSFIAAIFWDLRDWD